MLNFVNILSEKIFVKLNLKFYALKNEHCFVEIDETRRTIKKGLAEVGFEPREYMIKSNTGTDYGKIQKK